MRKGIEKLLQDQKDLAQEVVDLISYGITELQAKQALEFFPDPRIALQIVTFYTQSKDRKDEFGGFKRYLETIKTAMEDPNASKSLYQQEVEERTIGLPRILAWENYRDNPTHSTHYWEHLSSQDRG